MLGFGLSILTIARWVAMVCVIVCIMVAHLQPFWLPFWQQAVPLFEAIANGTSVSIALTTNGVTVNIRPREQPQQQPAAQPVQTIQAIE